MFVLSNHVTIVVSVRIFARNDNVPSCCVLTQSDVPVGVVLIDWPF